MNSNVPALLWSLTASVDICKQGMLAASCTRQMFVTINSDRNSLGNYSINDFHSLHLVIQFVLWYLLFKIKLSLAFAAREWGGNYILWLYCYHNLIYNIMKKLKQLLPKLRNIKMPYDFLFKFVCRCVQQNRRPKRWHQVSERFPFHTKLIRICNSCIIL